MLDIKSTFNDFESCLLNPELESEFDFDIAKSIDMTQNSTKEMTSNDSKSNLVQTSEKVSYKQTEYTQVGLYNPKYQPITDNNITYIYE